MTKIHLFGHGESARTVLGWLSRECRISAQELASIIHYPQPMGYDKPDAFPDIPKISIDDVRNVVSKEDVVIVAGDFLEQAVGDLLTLGIHNIYDGNEIVRRESAVHRFMKAEPSLYIGPTTPTIQEPTDNHAPRFSLEPIEAKRIPRHKLFIINSMPKSGTVWMAAMLEDILGVKTREQITISHVGDIESDWHKKNNHGALTLVRDMRDVVISWFHHQWRSDLQFGYSTPRYPTIEEFYWDYLIALIFGTNRYYFGDLERWINLLGANSIPIIKYEELVSDTERCLRKVMNFWKVDVPSETLQAVTRNYSFSSMKDTVANQDGFISSMVCAGHMRRGQIGVWRDEMPVPIAEDIEQRFASYQKRLGYV